MLSLTAAPSFETNVNHANTSFSLKKKLSGHTLSRALKKRERERERGGGGGEGGGREGLGGSGRSKHRMVKSSKTSAAMKWLRLLLKARHASKATSLSHPHWDGTKVPCQT